MKLSSWSSRRGLAAAVVLGAVLTATPVARAQRGKPRAGPAAATALALEIADYASLPATGLPDGTGNNAGSLARINVMRQEPGQGGRLFINDLTGPLYILDPRTKSATTYLDFNGRGPRTGLFDKLTTDAGLASGFISFEFDPEYARNGRFYTIHLEEIALPGSLTPDNQSFAGLDVAGYAATAPIPTPGSVDHEGVLIEWTDSNIANTAFEGRARELLRIPLNSRIHPLGDVSFNPAARPGDADWRVLYVACGDGGSGDSRGSHRLNPQRLDTLVGKILRIVPDLAEHATDSTVSDNGRYRVPRDNPFVTVAGARPEIWAYGVRNPHRLSWHVEGATAHLIASMIGWRIWETVLLIHKGGNYGFPLREGGEIVEGERTNPALPQPDVLPVQVTESITAGTGTPLYPVLRYGHGQDGGDAIAGGFVYSGKRIPQLAGKFVFGDISTGRLWWADFKEMRAADDGVARTMASIHELQVWWDDPADSPDRGRQLYPTLAPIVSAAYHSRGGRDPDLPGTAAVAGSGRVDLRFAVDRRGEPYLLTKSDGVVRSVVGLSSPAMASRRNRSAPSPPNQANRPRLFRWPGYNDMRVVVEREVAASAQPFFFSAQSKRAEYCTVQTILNLQCVRTQLSWPRSGTCASTAGNFFTPSVELGDGSRDRCAEGGVRVGTTSTTLRRPSTILLPNVSAEAVCEPLLLRCSGHAQQGGGDARR